MIQSNRITELFNRHQNQKEKIFMPFLVAGDPNIEEFKKLALAIEPYIDILEIGVPFSDPIADGPTIQEANVRAFNAGINTKLVLDEIKKLRMNLARIILLLLIYLDQTLRI
jgi:tryptophan synthase alpha chain